MAQTATFPPADEAVLSGDLPTVGNAVNGAGVVPTTGSFDSEEVLYEIVNNQRVEKPPMSTYSARIAFLIASGIENFAESHKKGQAVTEALFRLGSEPNLQRRPDAAFVSFERWPESQPLPHTDPWLVVPDLVAEVISPTNTAESVLDRVAEYFRAGVRLVWFVYPRHQVVHVYDSPTQIRVVTRNDELDGGPVLAGFRLPLASLFGPAPQPA
jgi:Uma2 family endonuclease